MTGKIAFVRDLKIDELGRLLKTAYKNKSKYSSRVVLARILLKNKKYVFPKRRSVSYKSVTNAFVTPSNLNLIDNNGNLTEDGFKLEKLFSKNYSKYKFYLASLLLKKGNWILIIKSIETMQKKKINVLTHLRDLVRELIKRNVLEPGIDVYDMGIRIKSNHIRWLDELGVIKINNGKIKLNNKMIIQIMK